MNELSREDVSRVARLARLALHEDRVDVLRAQLAAVLGHMRSLSAVPLDGVEPLAHPCDDADRWDDDTPRAAMSREALMSMAPDISPPFVKVPKVLGESG